MTKPDQALTPRKIMKKIADRTLDPTLVRQGGFAPQTGTHLDDIDLEWVRRLDLVDRANFQEQLNSDIVDTEKLMRALEDRKKSFDDEQKAEYEKVRSFLAAQEKEKASGKTADTTGKNDAK